MSEILEIIEEEQLGSDYHSYLQVMLSHLILNQKSKEYLVFSELSILLEKPYIIEAKEDTQTDKEIFLVKPDISIFRIEDYKHDFKKEKTKINKIPLCTIEILSNNQTFNELIDKVSCYFNNGVQSSWIVYPKLRTIAIFSNKKSIYHYDNFKLDDILKDHVLDIEIEMNTIFEIFN